jgi:hypothetical protein
MILPSRRACPTFGRLPLISGSYSGRLTVLPPSTPSANTTRRRHTAECSSSNCATLFAADAAANVIIDRYRRFTTGFALAFELVMTQD